MMGKDSSSSAADAQAQASQQATQAQLAMYNQNRQDQAGYRYGGGQAYNSLLAAVGLNPYSDSQGANALTSGAGGFTTGGIAGLGRGGLQVGGGSKNALFPGQKPGAISQFTATPGYQFVKQQGMQGIERSAAARGGAFSGNALKALDQYNNGLASQEYGNWWNRLAGLSGIGQTATNQTGMYGQNAANQIGQNTLYGGDARASGTLNGTNALLGGFNTALNNYYSAGGFGGGGGGGFTPNSYSPASLWGNNGFAGGANLG
jgi:hypothetical protein